MSESAAVARRLDEEIEADVQHLIATYPPLAKDRHAFAVQVQDGVVTASGHVQTPITRRYFFERAIEIPGVVDVNVERLYDDENLRLDIGKALPPGVRAARIQYGGVVLTGAPPPDSDEKTVVKQIEAIPGVQAVVTAFRS